MLESIAALAMAFTAATAVLSYLKIIAVLTLRQTQIKAEPSTASTPVVGTLAPI